ncbi:uncharacterized protein LOC5515676 [Nematostella vectensis]|uniref:uncharacterized protein LOC5515676 n=1 Tax=Nematostella vectensis TaxID=45351 RepID=UPI0020774F91|nr:uncharacterized protein LOC5515676 [Nematostella vectensis]
MHASLDHVKMLWLSVVVALTTVAHSAAHSKWPSGQYGLPRPKSGCPENWMKGRRFTDTEAAGQNKQFKDWFHLSGFVSNQGVEQDFCMKTDDEGVGTWPAGRYCILKGTKCPKGLVEGYIHWTDRSYSNQVTGRFPLHKRNTKVEYCCNANGNPHHAVTLPVNKPFYLYAYGSNECQTIKGAHVKKELVHFDENNQAFHDGEGGANPFNGGLGTKSHRLTYCYYEPVQTMTITQVQDQVEKALFTGDQLDNKSQSSALAVAIGVGVACAMMGTATIAFFAKRLIGRKDEDDDDDTPRPDD